MRITAAPMRETTRMHARTHTRVRACVCVWAQGVPAGSARDLAPA